MTTFSRNGSVTGLIRRRRHAGNSVASQLLGFNGVINWSLCFGCSLRMLAGYCVQFVVRQVGEWVDRRVAVTLNGLSQLRQLFLPVVVRHNVSCGGAGDIERLVKRGVATSTVTTNGRRR